MVLLRRCFAASAGSLSAEELDMCTVTLQALAAACTENGQLTVEKNITDRHTHLLDRITW